VSPAILIGIVGAAFVASHLLLSHPPVRGPLVRRMGEWPFRALNSVVSLATFVPLIVLFVDHRGRGPMLFLIPWAGITHVTEAMVITGFALVAGSFAVPPPSSLAAPKGPAEVRGMTAITRHPVSMGVSLWAFGHMLVNPWAVDVLFYATFIGVSLLGSWHQDFRKADEREGYREILMETTFFPWPSPKRLVKVGVMPAVGVIVGVVVAVVLRIFHAPLFG